MGKTLKNEYDFNFNGDKSNKFLSFIFGFLMYSVIIAIASCVFTYNLTNEWRTALNGHVTVEFQTHVGGTDVALTTRQQKEVFDIIKSFPGVRSTRQLQDVDILKILEPWLAGTAIPDDFPFPTIYDVEVDANANVDLLALSQQLSKVSQDVKIYNHANWYAPIMKVSDGLFIFGIILTLLVCLTVCTTVIFITAKTLNVHKCIVRILQLIGANNRYIARQFMRCYRAVGYKSAAIAICLGITTIGCINYTISGHILDMTSIQYCGIAILAPFIITLMITVVVHRTVLFFLKNDKWLN